MIQWFGSALVAVLFIHTKLTAEDNIRGVNQRFISDNIGLACIITIIPNFLMAYGDLSCLFRFSPRQEMRPFCFLVLARFVTYLDSILFSAVQFRSSEMRGYLHNELRRFCGVRCDPVEGGSVGEEERLVTSLGFEISYGSVGNFLGDNRSSASLGHAF